MGRTVAWNAKDGWEKGGTCVRVSADRMQASEGCPAAERATLSTLPSDRKVIVAWDMGSSDWRQARASGMVARKALWTAPSEGFNGTLPGLNVTARSLGVTEGAGDTDEAAGVAPTDSFIKASRPVEPAGGAGTVAVLAAGGALAAGGGGVSFSVAPERVALFDPAGA